MRSATGGPAFPVPGLQHDEDFNGMTLRDYFAAQALQALIRADDYLEGNWSNENVAQDAYALAGAMLAARGAP